MPTLTRDGVSLYYERHGEHGDPLLCIMGLGATIEFWEFQIPELSRAHSVLVYDNRGAGRSDKPPGPYATGTLAEDALALLDAVGFARAHVLGISMGGMIAQELALSRPDRVGALVLAATYARPDAQVREAAAMPPFDLSTVEPKQLFRFLTSLVLSPGFIERERVWLRKLRDRLIPTMTIEGFIAQMAATQAHDTSARLHALTAPTLVLMPTADQLVPPAASEELTRLIPGSRLVRFEGASHGFNVEEPEKFNRTVLDFLAEHPLH